MANPGILDSLASYPRWMVIACGILVAVAALWILGKLLKWAVWILVIVVVLAAGAFVVTQFVR